jgi:hypothetical protein
MSSASSLDHLVGAGEERFWDCQPKRLRSRQIDDGRDMQA